MLRDCAGVAGDLAEAGVSRRCFAAAGGSGEQDRAAGFDDSALESAFRFPAGSFSSATKENRSSPAKRRTTARSPKRVGNVLTRISGGLSG